MSPADRLLSLSFSRKQPSEDFTERDDKEWMKHSVTRQSLRAVESAEMTMEYRPVIDQPLDNEMPQVPASKRVY